MQHDTYIFLLGETLESWQAARQEFVKLAGSTPLLPDYAFGTWFTWWHPFDIDDAQSNVSQWEADQLPLDIWGLGKCWPPPCIICGAIPERPSLIPTDH
eukprot:COSAG01_NODE_1487_length_10136_cov_8.813390_3_plen_99_part_00